MIANPLIILGQIFIYVGINRFLDKKENKWALTSIFAIFNLFYYYFLFFENSISARTLVIAAVLVVILFISTYKLFLVRDELISSSARFTAIVFLAYSLFFCVTFFLRIDFAVYPVLFRCDYSSEYFLHFSTHRQFAYGRSASLLW